MYNYMNGLRYICCIGQIFMVFVALQQNDSKQILLKKTSDISSKS